jgi:gamma-glutamyltranspeptidase/glutathione hydrolase
MRILAEIVEFSGSILEALRSLVPLACVIVGLSACNSGNRAPREVWAPVDESVRKGAIAPPEVVSASGRRWILSTQGSETTRIAAGVLRNGGSLLDAAIAASFAISVERPHSTGIGGGGFLIHRDGKTGKISVFDFRERAPALAHPKMFLDARGEVIPGRSTVGGDAVAVPGLVRGLKTIHTELGRKSWNSLVMPAADLARRGFKIYPSLARAIVSEKEDLARFPDSRKIFLGPNGIPRKEGEILVQSDLSRTLRTIARDPESFYRGAIARKLVRSIRQHGGRVGAGDLRNYQVKQREPLVAEWRGYQMISMPPPSSGGLHVIQILKMLEGDDLVRSGFQQPVSLHLIASAMQQAFADRARYLGDPDFVPVPVEGLLAGPYLSKLRRDFGERARPAESVSAGIPGSNSEEHLETTHFSMMDSEGNAVVSTQTINDYFGSKVTAEGTGIVLNNEMDDFSAKVGSSNLFGATSSSEANQVEPFKTPLSSMSPTLVLKEGKPVLAVGAPGGTRIITAVAQTILNHLVYGLDLYQSVAAPRIHQQWRPDELLIENLPVDPSVLRGLSDRGWRIRRVPPQSNVMAVARTQDGFIGVSDPRDAGTSAGE